jgi:uncharacterized membrane protein
MWQSLKTFFLILPVFLALDVTWIGFVMKSFYDREVGDLARRIDGVMSPRWEAAVFVYILIPAGLVLFVRPLLPANGSYLSALRWGATFGLVLYGVYDLTNRSVLQNWSLTMTIVDIVWGCLLCGIVSVVMQIVTGGTAPAVN